MAKVTYIEEGGKSILCEAAEGGSILETALQRSIPHYHDCGANARCTTCRIRVVDGLESVSARSPAELEIAELRHWPDEIRLACQARVHGDVTVERLVKSDDERFRGRETHVGSFRSEEMDVAVLFCDVADFSSLSAGHMPYDVLHLVNRLFLRIGDAVLAYDGFIDKYMGDGLMALWGIDGGTPAEFCLKALRAGLAMQSSVSALNTTLTSHFGRPLTLRIGLHFGTAIVGTVGHPQRQQLTAIGDTVNVAARVELANKELLTTFLISEDFHRRVEDEVIVGDDFKTVLRGQSRAIRLFEVRGLKRPDFAFIVQTQMERAVAEADRLTEDFYAHFFARCPEAAVLFKNTPMRRQREVFLKVLVNAVREYRNLPRLSAGLRQLGLGHERLGVSGKYYDAAGAALLEALAGVLGREFTEESRTAWAEFYRSLVKQMTGTADS